MLFLVPYLLWQLRKPQTQISKQWHKAILLIPPQPTYCLLQILFYINTKPFKTSIQVHYYTSTIVERKRREEKWPVEQLQRWYLGVSLKEAYQCMIWRLKEDLTTKTAVVLFITTQRASHVFIKRTFHSQRNIHGMEIVLCQYQLLLSFLGFLFSEIIWHCQTIAKAEKKLAMVHRSCRW